ncbi:MAG: portal protein, partial [bacterium]
PQYMGEQADRSRALSQLDQKFGRFIERVQAQIIKGLNKIAALELFFKGYKKEDLENFKIELTPPSNVKEITEIDMFNQRMSLIATIQQLGIFTNEWILRRILKMSDREIADIQMQKKMEALQQGGTGEEGGGEGGDMSGGLPGEMPDLTGGEEGEETPAPEGGEEGEEAPAPEELTASVIINKLGKEFLIENKNDFLKLVKHVEDKNKETTIPMFESISELVLSNLITEKPKPRKRNGIFKQIAINELRGLNFNERNIKIYNSNDIKKDMLTEEVIYEEKTIECGNPKKTEK